jgi:thiamine pyrophosphate-dependent acetolactate synthase large subunit-like protein
LKKNIIHIDFTPAEVDTYYPPTIEIAADIEYTIEAILDELERQEEKMRKNTGLEGFEHRKVIPDLFQKIKSVFLFQ